ncbi:hypothetical protein fHeYen901_111 [Yersinia phage fHe-Yen9-01]|uniref:Uncharacterized protein n=1 Tax=Yersinia phage fHe-Yen9-01 TaxID=1965363 RepID=A0A1V0DXL6_9CAUD|nr:hypothetical protein KNT60_gp110 [Yersinia phage fHe-Yen9-01]ARB05884.1 hypothetical protein fHeYen901_111 [Yersinia phage fHe-Yen9-01]
MSIKSLSNKAEFDKFKSIFLSELGLKFTIKPVELANPVHPHLCIKDLINNYNSISHRILSNSIVKAMTIYMNSNSELGGVKYLTSTQLIKIANYDNYGNLSIYDIWVRLVGTGCVARVKKYKKLNEFGTIVNGRIVDVYGAHRLVKGFQNRNEEFVDLLRDDLKRIISDSSYLSQHKNRFSLPTTSGIYSAIDYTGETTRTVTVKLFKQDIDAPTKDIDFCIEMLKIFVFRNKWVEGSIIHVSKGCIQFTLSPNYAYQEISVKKDSNSNLDEDAVSTVKEILKSKIKNLNDEISKAEKAKEAFIRALTALDAI